jgi:manganese/zinc/iron transport system substrate-binding protein
MTLKFLFMRAEAALAILIVLALVGCAPDPADEADGRLRVVATTGMIADAAREIGGEHVVVTGLMGPGVDPHLYKASEGDVRRLFRAEVIFFHGLHLEARMADVLEHMGDRVRTVAVTSGVDPSLLMDSPEYPGMYDPHIWFDVRLWMEAVRAVRDGLVEAAPEHAEDFGTRTELYLAELEALDAYVRAQAERIPADERVMITAHDAFGYFGRAYGFEVRGLQGLSTTTEAGTADVQALASFIVERRIPAIFVESSIPTRTIEAVQAAARARRHDVRIGGELYSDALGDPDTPAGRYPGMVRHNIDTIVGALLRLPAEDEA